MCVGDGKQYVVVAIDTLPLHLPFDKLFYNRLLA